MNRQFKLTMMLATVSLLAACGGGGDDGYQPPPPAPPPAPDPLAAVPDSARQTSDGLVAYLKVLASNLSDSRDPVPLEGVTLPSSDTAEPGAI